LSVDCLGYPAPQHTNPTILMTGSHANSFGTRTMPPKRVSVTRAFFLSPYSLRRCHRTACAAAWSRRKNFRDVVKVRKLQSANMVNGARLRRGGRLRKDGMIAHDRTGAAAHQTEQQDLLGNDLTGAVVPRSPDAALRQFPKRNLVWVTKNAFVT
jgi:hypothetical protein